MGLALLDSNAVVGFLDADDALHAHADVAVRSASRDHALGVSVVTVAELLTGAKLGHHEEQTVRAFLREAVPSRIALDETAAERAAELRSSQTSLRLPDALILATADLHADILLTADRRWLKTAGLSCEIRWILDAETA